MQELLEFIVKGIVTKPEEVKVTPETSPEGELNLKLKVAPEDMGTVIGKGGRIIRAIRSLVRIKAIHEDKRVNVELEEVPGYVKPLKEGEAPSGEAATAEAPSGEAEATLSVAEATSDVAEAKPEVPAAEATPDVAEAKPKRRATKKAEPKAEEA